MQRCEQASQERHSVPQRLAGREVGLPRIGHEMFYIGPRGPIPSMVSPALARRMGLESFGGPLDETRAVRVAWSFEVSLDGVQVYDAVGACVDEGWVARYAKFIPMKTGPRSYLSAKEAQRLGRDLLETESLRAVEIVFGTVSIGVGPVMRAWAAVKKGEERRC